MILLIILSPFIIMLISWVAYSIVMTLWAGRANVMVFAVLAGALVLGRAIGVLTGN